VPVVLVVAASTAVSWALASLAEVVSLAPLVAAVAYCSWAAGVRAGALATALGLAAAWAVVFPDPADVRGDEVAFVALVLVVAAAMVVFGEAARRAGARERAAADAARAAETLLGAMFEFAPVGFAVLDPEGRYARINPWLATLNGLPAEAHRGLRPSEVLGGDPGDAAEELIRQVQDTGTPILAVGMSGTVPGEPAPRAFELNMYPVRLGDGRPWVGVAVVDVTEQQRLVARHRGVAQALQRALAPPELPHIPGVETAVAYVPFGEGNDVGGDFYDLYVVDGRIRAVIGDVCGKGPSAGATGAFTRQVARSLGVEARTPADVLRRINAVVARGRGDDRAYITALCACFRREGDGMRLDVAAAGHPPAMVLRASGEVEAVGRPGTPIGPFHDIEVEDDGVDLLPGDTVLLYTDGVTEARAGGGRLEQEGLTALVGAHAGASPQELVDGVREALAAGGLPRDDIALVAIRVSDAPARVPAGVHGAARRSA